MDTIIENCKLINKIGNFYVGIKNGKIKLDELKKIIQYMKF